MPRQRLHPVEDLLDVAEQLVTSGDPAGLTLRALAASAGASNGTIYHAFGSREELLARLWLRASERLGTLLVAAAGSSAAGAEAVVAAALAPVTFTREHPASAQLFFAQRSDQLFTADLPVALTDALAADRRRFTGLLTTLARGVWDRRDRYAVEAVAACVVDVPGGILRRALIERRAVDAASERRIEAAVRAILAEPLDPPTHRPSHRSRSTHR
ncbi:TetR/AcrR family transcriptional regulator [Pimelobacter simplex]|uniref:TetR/AcrR family transcriptional regulator n=1 Tax=Nocardioides simplex TaxID=2045 RepID=UPI00214FF796|nr:TetR/AcrR family transcriptional regulator [Pimelobacter simplex]UUW88811.1 TetR/AcrR family transcriptional regulator [Pimelobacter simplex]UUW98316.1 TetR/AcrR family transcriptional regulator [Pimelobacter simplex]